MRLAFARSLLPWRSGPALIGGMKFPLLSAAVAFLLLARAGAQLALEPQSFESEVTIKVGYHYLLTLPEGYDADPAKKWPLLVFLHGAGERGSDLNLLKKHGPPKLIAAGHKFEAVVVCPQVPTGDSWNAYGVKALIDQVRKDRRIDDSRIYLTGISMGGFGTFETIAQYPDLFAAAVPICGGPGANVVKFGAVKDLPIWIFHGGKDPVVPVAYSQMAYKWLQNMHAPNAKLTIYPEAQHDSWTKAYDDPSLWEWLFAQKKK